MRQDPCPRCEGRLITPTPGGQHLHQYALRLVQAGAAAASATHALRQSGQPAFLESGDHARVYIMALAHRARVAQVRGRLIHRLVHTLHEFRLASRRFHLQQGSQAARRAGPCVPVHVRRSLLLYAPPVAERM